MQTNTIEDGLYVIYVGGARYEETTELDEEGRVIFQYTGPA